MDRAGGVIDHDSGALLGVVVPQLSSLDQRQSSPNLIERPSLLELRRRRPLVDNLSPGGSVDVTVLSLVQLGEGLLLSRLRCHHRFGLLDLTLACVTDPPLDLTPPSQRLGALVNGSRVALGGLLDNRSALTLFLAGVESRSA